MRWLDDMLANATEEAHGEPSAVSRLRRRFGSSVLAGATGVVMFAVVLVLYLYSRHDALMSVLLRDRAFRMITDLGACLLVLGIAAILIGKYILSPKATRTGATATIAVFSTVVAILFARNCSSVLEHYEQITATEVSMMGRLAELQRTGSTPRELSEEAPGELPGRIVAITNADSINLIWEKNVPTWIEATKGAAPTKPANDSLSRIYEGKLQRSATGDREVYTKTGNFIKVSNTASDARVSDGAEVLVLVPDMTANASKLYPIYFGLK